MDKTRNKMAQPRIRRQEEEGKGQRGGGNLVGRKKRLDTFCPLTHIKWK
jgi:hypothetical protein